MRTCRSCGCSDLCSACAGQRSRRRQSVFRVFLTALISAIALGCAAPDKVYIDADRKTFAAIAPEYLEYVLEDPELDELDRQLRVATIIFWDERIRAEEERQGVPTSEPFPHLELLEDLASAGIRTLDGSPEPE